MEMRAICPFVYVENVNERVSSFTT